MKTEDAKKTLCPLSFNLAVRGEVTQAERDRLWKCLADECQWWIGDEKEGRYAVAKLAEGPARGMEIVEMPLPEPPEEGA